MTIKKLAAALAKMMSFREEFVDIPLTDLARICATSTARTPVEAHAATQVLRHAYEIDAAEPGAYTFNQIVAKGIRQAQANAAKAA